MACPIQMQGAMQGRRHDPRPDDRRTATTCPYQYTGRHLWASNKRMLGGHGDYPRPATRPHSAAWTG
jgi:hypothetical protein